VEQVPLLESRLQVAEAHAEKLTEEHIAETKGTQQTLQQVKEEVSLHQSKMEAVKEELEDEIEDLKLSASKREEEMAQVKMNAEEAYMYIKPDLDGRSSQPNLNPEP